MSEMNIEYIKTTDIKPYERNAKKHPQQQVEQIANSIREFKFRQPLVIDKNNVVVIGHGRLLAAKELGLEQVPCIRADDLTPQQIQALRLADNKTNESEWDDVFLEAELLQIGDYFNMESFGFDPISAIADDDGDAEIIEDEVPVNAEPRSKSGDVWLLGDHRLMCGDSTDPACWERLMRGEKADMVFTDPPYGVAIGDKNKALNAVQRSGRCIENIKNDTLGEEELYEMLKAAFINVRENCAPDAVYYVTSPQGGSLGLMMMMMMKDAGLEVRHVLMWRKNAPTFSLGRLDYDYQHEPIFYTWTDKHHNYRKGKYRSTVWDFDKPRKCDVHPTMKPVELVANAILDGTVEGNICVDAFGGSGTTIIACEQLNRRGYMMELDPKYVDVIIKRWEDFTGCEAVLENGVDENGDFAHKCNEQVTIQPLECADYDIRRV